MTAQYSPPGDAWYRSAAPKTGQTDDERIKDITVLPPPEHLIRFFPIQNTPVETLVSGTRQSIQRIMRNQDDRLLVIVGPCSIHNPEAALDYARRLADVREQYQDTLEIVMRVYFEKPRTTVGWKGLINDPYLDGSYRIDEGLRIARQLLIDINRLGVPAASEFLDVISPQYIGDLISWGAIGARTTESQVHRELASGISAPIGFKNGTDGNIRIATDAIQSASRGHHFLSVHKNGPVAPVPTAGNHARHLDGRLQPRQQPQTARAPKRRGGRHRPANRKRLAPSVWRDAGEPPGGRSAKVQRRARRCPPAGLRPKHHRCLPGLERYRYGAGATVPGRTNPP